MRILLASDGSSGASVAEALLCSLSWPAGTEVEVVMVVDPRPPRPYMYPLVPDQTAYESFMNAEATSVVESVAERIAGLGFRTKTAVLRGTTVDRLVERGIEIDASLIICGSRGHGPLRTGVFGSVGRAVADQAGSSVLIARQPQATRVLLASDGSPTSFAAEQAVMTWPAFASLPIDLVRVDHTEPHLLWHAQPAPAEECGRPGWTVARLQACGRHASETHLVGEPARKVLCHAADSGADTHRRRHPRPVQARPTVARQRGRRDRGAGLVIRAHRARSRSPSEQRRGGTPIRVTRPCLRHPSPPIHGRQRTAGGVNVLAGPGSWRPSAEPGAGRGQLQGRLDRHFDLGDTCLATAVGRAVEEALAEGSDRLIGICGDPGRQGVIRRGDTVISPEMRRPGDKRPGDDPSPDGLRCLMGSGGSSVRSTGTHISASTRPASTA